LYTRSVRRASGFVQNGLVGSREVTPGHTALPVILEELKKSLLNNSLFLEKRVMQSFAFR
jgi:hypothetical protein